MTDRKRRKKWTSPVEKEIRMEAGQKKTSFGRNRNSGYRPGNTGSIPAGAEGYEAFISYRHLDTDIFIAENLHKLLEHYTIPRSARKLSGARHIRHIFRDRDELPISADLSASITDALRRSDWLIVICTPQTRESMWVKKEIETFLQTHSRDNIILVLADGEPEQSFPEEVRFAPDPACPGRIIETEPLAADVRGKDNKERLKKMKEEKLRILAALLRVPYDSLVQRDRDYRLKRTAGIGAVVGSCILAFGLYTSWQNVRIRNLYNETNHTLAESVSETASSSYRAGDREGAVRQLLSAADEKGNLLSPEQIYPLARMMNAYQTGMTVAVYPADYVRAGNDAAGLEISESTKTAAWKGDSEFQFYDLENRRMIRSVQNTDLYRGFADSDFHTSDPASGIRLLDDETALIYSGGALFQINFQSGDVLKRIAVNGPDSSDMPVLKAEISGGRLTAAGKNFLKQYDLEDGLKEVFSADFEGTCLPNDFGMSVNPETGMIVLVSSRTGSSGSEDPMEGIFLVDPSQGEKGSLNKLSDENAVQSIWLDADHFAVLTPAISEEKVSDDGLPVFSNQFMLTTWKNGEKLKTSGPWSCTSSQQKKALSRIHLMEADQLALCSDFRIYFLNPLSHEVNWQSSYADEVNGVYSMGEEERFLVKTGSKNISVSSTSTEGSDFAVYVPLVERDNYSSEEPVVFWNDDGYFCGLAALSYAESGQYLTVYRPHNRPETGSIQFPSVMDVQFSSDDSKNPAVLAVGTEEGYNGLLDLPQTYQAVLFDEASGERKLEIRCEIDADALKATGLKPADAYSSDIPDDTLYPGFRLAEQGDVREVVWTDGKEIFRQKETEASPRSTAVLELKDPRCTAFSQNGEWAGIDDEKGFHLYHWSKQADSFEETQILELTGRTFAAEWTADQNYLVLQGIDWIRVWDMQKSQWVELEESNERLLSKDSTVTYPRQVRKNLSGFRLGKEKPLMLVSRTDPDELPANAVPSFLVYDLSTGRITARLDEASLNCRFDFLTDADQADFSQHDSSLILNLASSDGSTDELLLYSLKENKVVMRQNCPASLDHSMISDTVQASSTSPCFALTNSGGYQMSRTGGLETGADSVFMMDDSGFYPLALLETANAYFSPDMKKTVQGFDTGFILQPVFTSEELSLQAKEFLRETEERNREQQAEKTE